MIGMMSILYLIAMYLRNNMIFAPIIVPTTAYEPPSLQFFLNYLHTADFNLYLCSLRIYLVLFYEIFEEVCAGEGLNNIKSQLQVRR